MEETFDDLLAMKPKSWLSPPRQTRTRDDPAALRLLAENIAAIGMLNAIVALATGEIIAGHRRYQAAMLKDEITHVPVRIVDSLTARDIRVRRISENLQRSDLSFYDKYLECRGFRDEEPGISAVDIASALCVDGSTITRYLCLDHVIEAVRQAAKDERISMKAAYEISKEPFARQEELLAEALAGGAERVAKARRKRAGTVPAERIKRSRFHRPSGSVVTLTGELSLEEAASELSELASEMRKRAKDGISIRTFMDECRDRASV